MDIANQRIAYTISDVLPRRPLVGRVNNDGATLGDLAVALVSNSDFNANFTVDYGDRASQTKATLLGATGPAGVGFGDTGLTADDTSVETRGRTSVGVVVKFNGDISNLRDNADAVFPLDGTGATDLALAYDIAPRGPVPFPTGLTEGAVATNVAADAYDVTFVAPDDVVHISYTSDSMAKLPKRAGFRIIEADVAQGYPDNTLRRQYGYTSPTRVAYEAGDLGTGDATGTAPSKGDNSVDVGVGKLNVREILSSLRPNSGIKP